MATSELEKKFRDVVSLEDRHADPALRKVQAEHVPAISVITSSIPTYIPTKHYTFDANTQLGTALV